MAVISHDPVLIDPAGRLWLTVPDAPPVASINFRKLPQSSRPAEILTSTVVSAVLNYVDPKSARPWLLVPRSSTIIGDRALPQPLDLLSPAGQRLALPQNIVQLGASHFPGTSFFATGDGALAVAVYGARPIILPISLPGDGPAHLAAGNGGMFVWRESKSAVSDNAAYMALPVTTESKWTVLKDPQLENGWVRGVFPQWNGAVAVIASYGEGIMAVKLLPDPTALPPAGDAAADLQKLAISLGDDDPTNREIAARQLQPLGLTTLRRLLDLDSLAPAGRSSVEAAIVQMQRPTAGPFDVSTLDNADIRHLLGGALAVTVPKLYLRAPGPTESAVVDDAVLLAEGGKTLYLMDKPLVDAMNAAGTEISFQQGSMCKYDPATGLQVWIGNHFQPLSPKGGGSERFSRWLGTDMNRRQVLSTADGTEFLVVDPHLRAKGTPLAAWLVLIPPSWQDPGSEGDSSGCSIAGWPIIKKGNGTYWELQADGWVITDKYDVVPPPPIPDRDDWSGGLTDITHTSGGNKVTAALPTAEQGSGPPLIVPWRDKLLLMNTADRLVRLSVADGKATVETGVKLTLPTGPIDRAWVDPAGRVILCGPHYFLVVYADGVIPPTIRKIMTDDAVIEPDQP